MVTKEVEYEFYWYELDQPIKVDETEDFIFSLDDEMKFFSGLYEKNKSQIHNCKILEISHPELGLVQEIDTSGLDYTIKLANGDIFKVEAEEDPGKVYEYKIKPKEWKFKVKIEILD